MRGKKLNVDAYRNQKTMRSYVPPIIVVWTFKVRKFYREQYQSCILWRSTVRYAYNLSRSLFLFAFVLPFDLFDAFEMDETVPAVTTWLFCKKKFF